MFLQSLCNGDVHDLRGEGVTQVFSALFPPSRGSALRAHCRETSCQYREI